MKSTEEYLDDYHQKKNTLEAKNELWRLRVTGEEFIAGIEKIKKYGEEARKNNYINEFAIKSHENGQVEVLLMDKMTREEMLEQMERIKKGSEKHFTIEAPEIQKKVRLLNVPLRFRDTVSIYKWLFRKQITIEMIPQDVYKEFVTTRQYLALVKKGKI